MSPHKEAARDERLFSINFIKKVPVRGSDPVLQESTDTRGKGALTSRVGGRRGVSRSPVMVLSGP